MPQFASGEYAALQAVLEEDDDRARFVLEDMFPTELKAFAEKVERLSDLIDEVARGKSAR